MAENGKCAELIHRFPQIGVAYHRLLSGDGIYSPQPPFHCRPDRRGNRLPGNEKIGLTIVPPAFSTAPSVSSSPVSHMALP
ncbi:hypothetical protein [Mesorhizobium sp.]|uniref:hypothetical protein n=1 Tax=Mesorhizobium sp. TaxID=1871066 RepID=UPI0025794499|nr:hypothetical protein [Mesorhizobium sp.]